LPYVLSASVTRPAAVAGAVQPRHLDDRHQQPRTLVEVGSFEQRLLLARVEGADHGDRGDEALARYRGHSVPIGRNLVLLEIALEAAQQAVAIEAGLVFTGEVAGEFAPLRHDSAIAVEQRQFLDDA